MLGAVWALWHAPLFLVPGNFHSGKPPVLFGVQVVASSLLYTRFHLSAAGSLVKAMAQA